MLVHGPRVNFATACVAEILLCSTPSLSFLYAELFSFMLNIVLAAPQKVVNRERPGGARRAAERLIRGNYLPWICLRADADCLRADPQPGTMQSVSEHSGPVAEAQRDGGGRRVHVDGEGPQSILGQPLCRTADPDGGH